jgi:DNA-binding LacI/PurR family transcriptional regulator
MTCTDPPLTTIREPVGAMGRALVAALVRQIDGGSAAADELLFEPELVVRGSTGPAGRPGFRH